MPLPYKVQSSPRYLRFSVTEELNLYAAHVSKSFIMKAIVSVIMNSGFQVQRASCQSSRAELISV